MKLTQTKVSLLAFVISLFLSLEQGISQPNIWKSIGPDGGNIEMVITAPSDSNIVYAAVRSGSVYRSNDGGSNWSFAGWFQGSVHAIAVHPLDANIIYAGISPDKLDGDALFKSTDGGSSWAPTAWGSNGILRLTIDPKNPQIIYVSSFATFGGIHKTEDDCKTWTFLPFPDNDGGRTFAIVVNPQNPNIIYVATNGWKFYRSSDRGKTWELAVDISGFPQWMDVNPANPKIIYLATSEGVFVSSNAGANWIAKNSPPINPDHPWTEWVFVDRANPKRIYRSNNHNWSLFISNDSGDTWKLLNMPCGSITMAGNNRLVVGTRDGVYTSDGNGGNAQFSSKGLHGTDVISLQVSLENGMKIYSAAEDQGIARANLYISDIDSILWQKQFFGRGISEIKIHHKNSHIIAAGFGIGAKGIKVSLEGGGSWSLRGPDSYIHSLEFSLRDSLVIYAGGISLFKSPDLGSTWEIIDLPLGYHSIDDIALGSNDSTIILCAMTGEDWSLRRVLLRSSDGGMTWAVNNIRATSVFIWPNNPMIILAAAHSELFRSEDFGESWDAIRLPLPGSLDIRAFQRLHDGFVALATSEGVFYSWDLGLTWSPLECNLPHRSVLSLSYIDAPIFRLFAGTSSGGVYSLDLGEILSVATTETSHESALFQNFPNPFNGKTTIRYRLPRPSYVTLQIFDILGQEVAIIESGLKNEGAHAIQWDGSRNASGIYFYRLKAGAFVETRKFLLLQ